MDYIGLLDCNNFFVSCERLFRPDLQKKPVAVLSSNDGCIVARSQEVKDMGVPMGIPLFQARQLVDMDAVVLFSSNFTLYRDISSRVMQVLAAEVGEIDVYSIDEAFFSAHFSSEAEIVLLREKIMQMTGIPVSIGVGKTKTLAKEASEIGKKGNGVCLLSDQNWQEKSRVTLCSNVWGLGRASIRKLDELGIKTVAQFMSQERRFIKKIFGIGGERIFDELHGIKLYELNDGEYETQKSATSSRSFSETTHKLQEIESAVAYHVSNVAQKLRERGLVTAVIYIELRASRHGDFGYKKGTYEVVLETPSNNTQLLTKAALQTVRNVYDKSFPYKKAGVTASVLIPEKYTSGTLFDSTSDSDTALDEVIDRLQQRFGFNALHNATILPNRDRSSVKLRSQAYTTAWGDIPTVHA